MGMGSGGGMRKITGFTLIELLVVLMVIAILAAISIGAGSYVINVQDKKRAQMEIEALRTALVDYQSKHGGYPTCPKKICTPGECLFLSLAGFHNEVGTLEIPPYPSLVPTTLFGYDPYSYDIAKMPDFSHNDGKSLILWLSKTLDNDVSFLDPWGNEYVYEYPREDGEPGYRLYSMGPDGETGDGFEGDDLD